MNTPKWHPPTNPPGKEQRILVFSDCYPQGHQMRFRLLTGQFLKTTAEATLWMDCEEILATHTGQDPKNPERETQEWVKNITKNEKTKLGDLKTMLLEACDALGLNKEEMDRRFQLAGPEDFNKKEGIYFLLTGKPHPSKKGYTWG